MSGKPTKPPLAIRGTKLKLRHCLIAWVVVGFGFVLPMSGKIQDPDIWWHLKTGELIVANRSVPTTDPFSFTAHGQPWTAHEWLSEVIFYGVFTHFGFIGLMLMESVLLSALMAGIYLLVRRQMEYGPLALMITALCGIAGWQLWSPRPQLFTYLLLIGLLFILRKPNARSIWLTVPMFWLWSNLHGAWILGYGVMAITLIDAGIRSIRKGQAREAGRMAVVCVLSLLAVLAGPAPIERLVYPLSYFNGQIPAGFVTEFQSPNFWNIESFPFELLLMAIGALLYLGRKPMRASEWILLGLMVHFSLHSARHMPLLGIIAAPILATQARSAMERLRKQPQPDSGKNESLVINILALMILPALVWMRFPQANDEAHCVEAVFPREACQYLVEHPKLGQGRLLNNYNWGGYLIFHLYPKYLVSIDGRADVHHAHMSRDLKSLQTLTPDWDKELRRQNPDVVLWPRDKALAVVLRCDPHWRVLYEDKKAIIFARKIQEPE